jgi:hypothetical protein
MVICHEWCQARVDGLLRWVVQTKTVSDAGPAHAPDSVFPMVDQFSSIHG